MVRRPVIAANFFILNTVWLETITLGEFQYGTVPEKFVAGTVRETCFSLNRFRGVVIFYRVKVVRLTKGTAENLRARRIETGFTDSSDFRM